MLFILPYKYHFSRYAVRLREYNTKWRKTVLWVTHAFPDVKQKKTVESSVTFLVPCRDHVPGCFITWSPFHVVASRCSICTLLSHGCIKYGRDLHCRPSDTECHFSADSGGLQVHSLLRRAPNYYLKCWHLSCCHRVCYYTERYSYSTTIWW